MNKVLKRYLYFITEERARIQPEISPFCSLGDRNGRATLTSSQNAGKIHLVFSGDIAQLGERLNGIQEVRGSNPLISTSRKSGKGR